MEKLLQFSKTSIKTNSNMWEVWDDDADLFFRVVNNKEIDHISGKVALFRALVRNYRMQAELRFLGHHLPDGSGGWFGFVMRAKDTNNYELVWFMPNAEGCKTAAYLSVAHGVVPWWTEAYSSQQKGQAIIPFGEWFQAAIEVIDDEFTLFVEGNKVFSKRLTYYLDEGYPGLYVGTGTDAMFRKIKIERLK